MWSTVVKSLPEEQMKFALMYVCGAQVQSHFACMRHILAVSVLSILDSVVRIVFWSCSSAVHFATKTNKNTNRNLATKTIVTRNF